MPALAYASLIQSSSPAARQAARPFSAYPAAAVADPPRLSAYVAAR